MPSITPRPGRTGLPGEWRNSTNSIISIHTSTLWWPNFQTDPSVATTPLLWATASGHKIRHKKLKLPLSSSGAFCNICFVTSQTESCAQCSLCRALKSCHGRKKAVRAPNCFPPSSRHHVYDSRGCVVTAAGRRQLCPPRSRTAPTTAR